MKQIKRNKVKQLKKIVETDYKKVVKKLHIGWYGKVTYTTYELWERKKSRFKIFQFLYYWHFTMTLKKSEIYIKNKYHEVEVSAK